MLTRPREPVDTLRAIKWAGEKSSAFFIDGIRLPRKVGE
jgi:hypothetical protein